MSLGKQKILAQGTAAGGGGGDVTTWTYVQQKTLALGSRGNILGACISYDGTRLYATHRDSSHDDFITQYNFGTAFDVSTIGSIVGTEQISASIPDYLGGCIVNNDNTWIAYDPYATSNYYAQPFGTAGDITTLGSLTTGSCARGGGNMISVCLFMSKNGQYVFMLTTSNLYRIELSTNYDFSTFNGASSGCGYGVSTSGIASDLGSDMQGVCFNSDGTVLYAGGRNAKIAKYTLSTAYDIQASSRSSATIIDLSANMGSSGDRYIQTMQFNTDYTKMLIVDVQNAGSGNDVVFEYNVS